MAVQVSPARTSSGFTLVELLVAMTIALIVTGGALAVFQDASRATEGVKLRLNTNDNIRIALDLLVRDLIQVGQGLPNTKVVAAPRGTGSTDVKRPAPGNLTYGGVSELSAVTPGDGLGPTINGLASDIVNIMYVDSQYDGLTVTLSPDGSTMTVDAATPIVGVVDPVRKGDLFLFTSGSLTALQMVTKDPANQTVAFDPADPMNINQRSAEGGSVTDLIEAGGSVLASRIRLVTYYLDASAADGVPRLVRQVNMRSPGQVVAVGIDNLQLTYDLVDGVTNPTGQPAPTNLNAIRKVNIAIGARSNRRYRQTSDYVRSSLSTQVSLRSLALVDRYQ